MPQDDTVWLSINNQPYVPGKPLPAPQKFGGWQSVRVTRGIERMPSDFEVTLTERYPDQPRVLPIQPGQACTVQFGASIVLSGWVDRVKASIDPQGHHITIIGRGRCCDLVDCSAYANNKEFMDHSVLDIATAVAAPFNIVVTQRDPGTPALQDTPLTADGQVIPQFNVTLTSTPWEIIEGICRYACLLAYESETGDLLLAQVGTTAAASGFVSGVNVQAASSVLGIDQRYSTIWAARLAIDDNIQLTPGGPPILTPGAPPDSTPQDTGNILAHPTDPDVPRYRPLVIVSEQGSNTEAITARRAEWEIARRYGRSQAVTLTVDSWRDKAGDLWRPNTLALIDIPELHLGGVHWLISEVSFIVDLQRGRLAEVTLMPPQAFTPQPPAALFDQTIMQDMQNDQPSPPVGGGGP